MIMPPPPLPPPWDAGITLNEADPCAESYPSFDAVAVTLKVPRLAFPLIVHLHTAFPDPSVEPEHVC